MAEINMFLPVAVDADDFARRLVHEMDNDDVLDFVVAIDEHVCELEWTVRLRNKLDEIIEREGGEK